MADPTTRPRMGQVTISADRKALTAALAYVNDIPDLYEHPWVHSVLLTATRQHVAVARNNGDQQYHADVDGAQALTPGVAAVNARELASAVSTMPANAGPVHLVAVGGKLTVTCAQARTDLVLTDAAELADRMPDLPDPAASATVSVAALAAAAQACSAVTRTSEPAYPLMWMTHIDLPWRADGWMRLAGTDRFRAARRQVDVVTQTGGFGTAVDAAGLEAAVRRFGKTGNTLVTVDHAPDVARLVLACGPYRAVLATREGERRIGRAVDTHVGGARDASASTVDVNVGDLRAALKRLVAAVKAKAKEAGVKLAELAVGLTFAAGTLHLAVRETYAQVDERIGCGYDGPAYRVAMRADLLGHGLKDVGGPVVRWHLTDNADGWEKRPQLWQPLGDDGAAVPGAEYLTHPVGIKNGHPLNAMAKVQDDAGMVPAPQIEEENGMGDNGNAKQGPINPWAQQPDTGDVDVAAMGQTAWQQVQAQEWAAALATVNQIVDLVGPDAVFTDGGGTAFKWGQVQPLVAAKAAEADAQADAEADDEADTDVPAERQPAQPVKATRARAAKATPAKAAKAPKVTKAQPARQPVAPPAVAVPQGIAPDLLAQVAPVAATLAAAKLPDHVLQAGVLAALAALTGGTPAAAPAVPAATARPGRAKPAPKAVPVVKGEFDGNGLRYALPRGTRVKATRRALSSALADNDPGREIGFHVETDRGDVNALVVTADAGLDEDTQALVNEVAAEVIAAEIGALATA